jgi:hypothetical protein
MGLMMEIEQTINNVSKLAVIPESIKKNYLASGCDSDVFRFENLVMKLYKSNLSFDTLGFYQEITYRAKNIVDGKINHDFGFPIHWKIVPFKRVGGPINYGGNLVNYSVSKYLPGATFRQLYDHDFSQIKTNQDPRIIHKLGTEKELIAVFGHLSKYLNQQFGYRGIDISFPNVKPFLVNNKHWFVITDLCSQIRELEKVY